MTRRTQSASTVEKAVGDLGPSGADTMEGWQPTSQLYTPASTMAPSALGHASGPPGSTMHRLVSGLVASAHTCKSTTRARQVGTRRSRLDAELGVGSAWRVGSTVEHRRGAVQPTLLSAGASGRFTPPRLVQFWRERLSRERASPPKLNRVLTCERCIWKLGPRKVRLRWRSASSAPIRRAGTAFRLEPTWLPGGWDRAC